ncbi:MAG TPA: sugar phosphate isomerase/epimerase [Ktedonobacterales bacterium]|nr:sugar phosphate isomerase/epimerase [Ktedonobacterales bacterium]
MRISLSTGSLYHRGLAYTLALARDAGFDGVELVVGLDYALGGLKRVTRLVREAEIPVFSVHPPFVRFPGWPRPVALRVLRMVDLARAVGAPVVVLHPPLIRSPQTPRAQRYTYALRLAHIMAGEDGPAVGLETIQYNKREQRYYLDDAATLTAFAAERGCGITYDTCHAGANGEDILATYELLRPALVNVHLSDVEWDEGYPRTHRIPGLGALPLAELVSRMARDGYDGPLTLEVHPKFIPLLGRARQLAMLRDTVARVRAMASDTLLPLAPQEEGVGG